MPNPETGFDQANPNTPLWTFDQSGNLALAGALTTGAVADAKGRTLLNAAQGLGGAQTNGLRPSGDSTGVTDYANIQALLGAVPANGGTVLLGPGIFVISSSLVITVSGTILAGTGWGTQIRFSGSAVGPAVTMGVTGRAFIRDIRISQTDATGAGTGINASNMQSGAIERVLVDGGGTSGVPPLIGVDFNSNVTFYNVLSDSRINASGTNHIGVRFSTLANSNTARNCRVIPSTTDTSGTGILVDAKGIFLDRVDIENAAGIGVDVTANGHSMTLVSPWLEANATNLRLASGVIVPTVLGGAIEEATTADITDNGSVSPFLLGFRAGSSDTAYAWGGRNPVPVPANEIQPADHGLISWAFDPATISNGSVPTSGAQYFVLLPIRYATTISKVWVIATTATAVVLTSGENFFYIYSIGATTATLLSSGVADSAFAGTGPQSISLATPQLVQPGYILAGFMVNVTSGTLDLARNTSAPAYGNINMTTAGLRFFNNGTGRTTSLSSPITLSSNSSANGLQDWWVGVS